MFDKLKELMELKRQAEELKQQLEAQTVEVSEGGIKIVITGAQNFKIIEIDPSLLQPENKKGFENDLLRSLNLAVKKSQNLVLEKMQDMTGLNLPGLYRG